MPSRNVVKQYSPESYYHIYARGASKQSLFPESVDKLHFISLFARYLSDTPQTSSEGVAYPHYKSWVELLCFCIMGNHFHLLIYQNEINGMSRFMQSLMTSYARYFNNKYRKSGPPFESRYKAVLISNDVYLLHISRYIHLNPRYWKNYKYSSIKYYLENKTEQWISTSYVETLFENVDDYYKFLCDYGEIKLIQDELKDTLANL